MAEPAIAKRKMIPKIIIDFENRLQTKGNSSREAKNLQILLPTMAKNMFISNQQ